MTQEEAMNMSNEQAVQILIPMRNMMCDQNGCPISDAVFALDKAIESLSADVAPIRHGRWEVVDAEEPKCSVCGTQVMSDEAWNYCPNCGARMDGDDKSCDTCKHYDKGWDDAICDGCTKAHSNWERRNDE